MDAARTGKHRRWQNSSVLAPAVAPFPVWICYLWRRYSFTSLPGLLSTTWDCLMRAIHCEERKSGLRGKRTPSSQLSASFNKRKQPSTGILPLQPSSFQRKKTAKVASSTMCSAGSPEPIAYICVCDSVEGCACIWHQSMGRRIM